MTLNQTQKKIILVAIFFVVAMILYPPWVNHSMVKIGTGRFTQYTFPGSYSFIFLPSESAHFIDLYRLGVQLVGVLVLAIGLCLVCSTKKQ